MCYQVDDLEAHIADMKLRKAVLIRPPKPAVAFGSRRIAWMVTRERLVVEYLERRLPETGA
jgi:methylmalonyl-CoA/ethylmalonyl-CoA epimerase